MRYWPWMSSSDVAERHSGLRALGRAHQLEFVDARDRGVEEAEAVLAPLDLQHGIRRAVDGEDVADEAVAREVLEERLAPPLRMRARVAGCRELAQGVVDVLVHRDAVVEAGSRRAPTGCRSRRRTSRPGCRYERREDAGPASRRPCPCRSSGRRSGTGRPCPCRRWRRCGPCGDRGTRRSSASRDRRRRPASSGTGCRPTDRGSSRGAWARSVIE